MKHTAKLLLTLLACALSGCASLYVRHDMNGGDVAADYQYQVLLEDTLLAVARPKTPLPEYADAWVLVGKAHSYLMLPQGKPAGFLSQLWQNVDMRYVRLHGQYSRDGLGAVLMAARPQQQQWFEQVRLDYRKPLSQVTPRERQSLQVLGFYCNELRSAGVYDCSVGINVEYLPISAANFSGKTVHRLPQPHAFKVVLRSEKNPNASTASWQQQLLQPLALVVDVVTLPVQIIGGEVVQGVGSGQSGK